MLAGVCQAAELQARQQARDDTCVLLTHIFIQLRDCSGNFLADIDFQVCPL